MSEKKYTVQDFNVFGYCSSSIHIHFDAYGEDYFAFVRNGLTETEIREMQIRNNCPHLQRFITEVIENGF